MKKTGMLAIIILLFAFVFSCAHGPQTVSKVSASPVLDRILERQELVVGTSGSMPPMNMTNKKGEIFGLEADLAEIIAGAMGVKLRFKAMQFSELLPALGAGKVDMILSTMTMTPQRNLKAAFVGPYFVSGKGFLTKIKTIAAMKDVSAINRPGTTLTALKGSTSQKFIETLIPKATLITTANHDEAVQKVINGEAHAMVADHTFCIVSVLQHPDKGLLSLISPITYEPIGIALPPDDPHLVHWLENLLNTLKGNGQLEDLKKHWFEDASWLKKLS